MKQLPRSTCERRHQWHEIDYANERRGVCSYNNVLYFHHLSLCTARSFFYTDVQTHHLTAVTVIFLWTIFLAIPCNDDVIKWTYFPRYWPFVWGIHRSPVNSPHKGQWHAAAVFSFICAWIHVWKNNREAGYLRRHRAHYVVTVMASTYSMWAYHRALLLAGEKRRNIMVGAYSFQTYCTLYAMDQFLGVCIKAWCHIYASLMFFKIGTVKACRLCSAKPLPEQPWFIVNWTFENVLQWNLN